MALQQVCVSAFQVSGEQLFADVAKDILVYVSRDLSDKVNHLQPCQDFCKYMFPHLSSLV